jgi:hypothetical protein
MKNWKALGGTLMVAALWVGCQAKPQTDDGKASEGGKAAGSDRAPLGRASRPTPEPVVLPEGATLTVTLQSTVSSDKNRAGDTFLGRLEEPIEAGGRVVVPAGAEVRGKVVAAQGSGRVKGRARLAVSFDRIEVGGKKYDIETSTIDVTAGKQKGRDAKIIGGSAAAGALIGAIAGGGGGAGKGVLIGGAAGTGAVLATKGKEIEFAAGNRLQVKLQREVAL